MGRKQKLYSEEFKFKVVQEVLRGQYSKEAARRHYGIKSKSGILEWTRQFSGESGFDSQGKVLNNRSTPKLKSQQSVQNERILELEEALRVEKLKVALSNTMIDIAEKEFGIAIRKKSGAKQSKSSKKKEK